VAEDFLNACCRQSDGVGYLTATDTKFTRNLDLSIAMQFGAEQDRFTLDDLGAY